MITPTSPLVQLTQVKGVFVRNCEDWESVGNAAWDEMMEKLAAQPPTRRVMGIDSEWFRKNPLATVQVATATHCFVIHLSYLTRRVLPDPVKRAFEADHIIKCGVGVSGDVKRLQNEQHLCMKSVMDLGNYATLVGLSQFGKTNLAALAKTVCGVDMEKDHMMTRSNWELPLSQSQFSYAADDAVASFLVGDRIMQEAAAKFTLKNATFSASLWLSQNESRAAASLKQILRAKQRENTERQQRETAAMREANGLLTVPQSPVRVRVLGKNGNFLFDCSMGRAKFYVDEKEIATVTKTRPENPRKPLEIRLNFENQTRTRLCMYYATGQCEFGEHCPFAHGVEQLCESSKALLTDATTITCAFCLAPKKLMRHAIVPPSFRKFLPKPIRFPTDTADFVPICTQCNTFIRHYYDCLMKEIYRESEQEDAQGEVRMDLVARSVSYARLLLDEKKLAKVPAERQEQIKEFILANWAATRMFDKDEATAMAQGGDAEAAATGTGVAASENKVEEQCMASPVASPSAPRDETKNGYQDSFEDDWESLEVDGDAAAAVGTESEFPSYKFFVDKNGTKVPVRDRTTGHLNVDFLQRLSHVVPGEVRARVTVQTLVGQDKDKAIAFVERWRAFCVSNCGMVEKPSNHLTGEMWEELAKSNSKNASRHGQLPHHDE